MPKRKPRECWQVVVMEPHTRPQKWLWTFRTRRAADKFSVTRANQPFFDGKIVEVIHFVEADDEH